MEEKVDNNNKMVALVTAVVFALLTNIFAILPQMPPT